MMLNTVKKKTVCSLDKILMAIYIFMSYNANDLLLPSFFGQISLYVFLLYGFLSFIHKSIMGTEYISTYTIWYIVFIGVSLITKISSIEKGLLAGQFYFMMVSVCLTLLVQNSIKNDADMLFLCWTFVVSTLCLIFSLLITRNFTGDTANRLGQDLTGNANSFACFIMIATLFALWMLIYKIKNVFQGIIVAISILFNILALVLSGGRNAFLIPFVFFSFLILLKKDKSGKRHLFIKFVLIMVMAFVIVMLIMNIPVFYNAIGMRFESFFRGVLGLGNLDGSANIRGEMRKLARLKWIERPIFGYGFDNFKYLAEKEFGHFYYSHCNFTELLYNGGIVLFIVYYWFYCKIFKDAIKSKTVKYEYRVFAISVVFAMLVYDYSIITYSVFMPQLILATSNSVLSFKTSKGD